MSILLQLLVAALALGSVYALFALGVNVSWSMGGVINIAQGEIMTLGAYATFFLIPTRLSVVALGAFFVTVGVAAYVTHRGLTRILGLKRLEDGSIVITWGLSLFTIGSLEYWVGTDFRSVFVLNLPIEVSGVTITVAAVIVLGVSIGVSVALALWLRFTRVGRALRAIAEDPDLASSVGIDVRHAKALAFVVGTLLAVLAGVLISNIYVFYPQFGQLFTLKGFAIVLVAGLGRLGWAWVVAIGLAVTETFIQFYINPQFADLVAYVGLIGVLLVRRRDLSYLRSRMFASLQRGTA